MMSREQTINNKLNEFLAPNKDFINKVTPQNPVIKRTMNGIVKLHGMMIMRSVTHDGNKQFKPVGYLVC